MGWRDWFGLAPIELPSLPAIPVKVTGPSLPIIQPITSPEPDMTAAWEMSDSGIALLMRLEAFRDTAYPDSGGLWTIGYGSTRVDGIPVKKGDTITMPKAIACLRQDVKAFVSALQRSVTVPLNQNQIDALTCFMYNVGGSGFAKSTLRKTINAGKPVTEDLFTRWNKVKDQKTGKYVVVNGLTTRRKREYKLYMS